MIKDRDEYAVVLDFLPYGYLESKIKRPIVLAIGENTFALLELIPKQNNTFELLEEVYIGPDKRDKIQSINRRLYYNRLTSTAQSMLEDAIEKIVKKREKEFVEFFNKVGPVTIRMHALELLPYIGKKHMMEILEEREKKPFESFEDMKERIKLLPDPVKIITKRILEEIQNPNEKYRLFVKSWKSNKKL